MYVYIHIYAHVCLCIYVYMRTYIHMNMCIYVPMCMYIGMYTHMHMYSTGHWAQVRSGLGLGASAAWLPGLAVPAGQAEVPQNLVSVVSILAIVTSIPPRRLL